MASRYLPTTRGPHNVGCSDIISKYGKDRIFFRLFYPTSEKYSSATAAQVMPELEYAGGLASFFGLSWLSKFFFFLTKKLAAPAKLNAKFDVPTTTTEKLPVAVFSPGLGGNRLIYQTICSDLASYGVVVGVLEHADQSSSATYYLSEDDGSNTGDRNTCPATAAGTKVWIEFLHGVHKRPNEFEIRNGQVTARARECTQLLTHLEELNSGVFQPVSSQIDLSSFQNRLDLDKVALLGHSFGGATVLKTVSKDKRFKVAVGLDVWTLPLDKEVYTNIDKSLPMMFLNTETFQWPSQVADLRKLDADDDDQDGNCGERVWITTKGTVHQSQSDAPFLLTWKGLATTIRTRGPLDPAEAFRVNNDFAFAFVSQHLGLNLVNLSVDEMLVKHSDFAMAGTNVQVDEERIAASKKKLKAQT